MNRAEIMDGLNYLGKLNPRKLQNSGKLVSSYLRAKSSNKARHAGMPISLSIEPTTSCNLRCPECPSGLRSFTRPTGMLEPQLFSSLLEELSPWLTYLIFYFQGEPFLHPEILGMVREAADQNIYTATSTNAHFLDEEMARKTVESGLDRLIISIDGTTQESYSSYRIGGKLDQVLEGTRNIMHWKKALKSPTPHVIFQFLVVQPNEHQIDDVKRLGREIGVDEVKFKTAQIYDYQNGSDLIPTIDRYARYKQTGNGQWEIKNPLENHCWKMWHSAVVTWDGKVLPCCFDKDAEHAVGNVRDQGFTSIWTGEEYNHFRQMVLNSRSSVDMCTNCTEGTRIWA